MRSRRESCWKALVVGACGMVIPACSSGGGGGSKPVTIGFESASSTEPEGGVASVTVVLSSSVGPLLEPATATVLDPGGGTSTGGADHDFTAARAVTFPVGSDDGATLTVDVAVAADLSIEGGDETLGLALAAPSEGVSLGSERHHTLTIADADKAMLTFTASSSSTANEDTPLNVDVELQLGPGQSLDVDIDVRVRDDGSGTATSGVDYAAFATATVAFASGTAGGTRQALVVTPLEDLDVEGDENAMLVFDSPSPGAQVQGTGSHMVTITDDDLSALAHLVVTGRPLGSGAAPVSSGDAFDLGVESLGSGANGALELELRNAGAQPFQLEPLVINGDTRDFTIDLQPDSPSPLVLATPAVFPFAMHEEEGNVGACLDMDAELCAILDDSDLVLMDGVQLPGGLVLTLQLERLELPFTDDALILVDGADVRVEDVVGDLSLWKGSALEVPGSEVHLAFSNAGSHGWLDLGVELGTVHLITEYGNGEPEVHWLWDTQLEAAYTGAPPATCQAALLPPGVTLNAAVSAPPASQSLPIGLTVPECRLAIETDYQYWQKFGDTGTATQYATQMIAALSAMYERDVQTTLSIAYLGIHSNANDGWTTAETGGNTGDMLDEFQAAWTGNWPVQADLAHFLSGASLGGGIAYLGVICSQTHGFGVSANINGNIDWGSFTGSPNVSNWDFSVVAHELGHNFGAAHTHDYCPPLDQCASNCNGSTSCSQGTIMSYCHSCGGLANIRLEFHPHVAAQIRAEVASSCLSDAQLDPGSSIAFTVSFEPTSGTGSKAATLQVPHSATNAPSPFAIDLTGTATN